MARKLTKVEICQRVVEQGGHKYVTAKRGRLCLDYLTAQGFLLIHSKLTPENQAKFESADWEKVSNLVWKHIKLR